MGCIPLFQLGNGNLDKLVTLRTGAIAEYKDFLANTVSPNPRNYIDPEIIVDATAN